MDESQPDKRIVGFRRRELLGLEVVEYNYEQCKAIVSEYNDDGTYQPTLYSIATEEDHWGEGQATYLLSVIKDIYAKQSATPLIGTIPLNPEMEHIYKKLGIDWIKEEFTDFEAIVEKQQND